MCVDKRDIICIMAAALETSVYTRYPQEARRQQAIDEAIAIWDEVTERRI